MCKRNSPDKKEKKKGEKRRKKKANTGCVRETPLRKVNPKWDV